MTNKLDRGHRRGYRYTKNFKGMRSYINKHYTVRTIKFIRAFRDRMIFIRTLKTRK